MTGISNNTLAAESRRLVKTGADIFVNSPMNSFTDRKATTYLGKSEYLR